MSNLKTPIWKQGWLWVVIAAVIVGTAISNHKGNIISSSTVQPAVTQKVTKEIEPKPIDNPMEMALIQAYFQENFSQTTWYHYIKGFRLVDLNGVQALQIPTTLPSTNEGKQIARILAGAAIGDSDDPFVISVVYDSNGNMIATQTKPHS